MLPYLKASYTLLNLLRSIDFSKVRNFRIEPWLRQRDYVLGAFLRRNNHLTATDEQLSRKLDQFLEDHKHDIPKHNKN